MREYLQDSTQKIHLSTFPSLGSINFDTQTEIQVSTNQNQTLYQTIQSQKLHHLQKGYFKSFLEQAETECINQQAAKCVLTTKTEMGSWQVIIKDIQDNHDPFSHNQLVSDADLDGLSII